MDTLPKDVLKLVLVEVWDCKSLLGVRCTCLHLNCQITSSLIIQCTDIWFLKKRTRPSLPCLKIEQSLMGKWYQDNTPKDNQITLTPHYLCFLQMLKYFPGDVLAPPDVVDAVWHNHIVDTRGYAAFCDHFFGRFVHHDPGIPQGYSVERVKYDTYTQWSTLFGSVAFDETIWKAEYNCYGVHCISCCWEGKALIKVDGGEKVFVKDVKVGDGLMGADGRLHKVVKVEAFEGKVRKRMVRLGDFWITRGHPVLWNGEWFRPDELFPATWMEVEGLYNFVLEDEHTVIVGGEEEYVCCTLGKDCGERLKVLFPHQDQFYGLNYVSKSFGTG